MSVRDQSAPAPLVIGEKRKEKKNKCPGPREGLEASDGTAVTTHWFLRIKKEITDSPSTPSEGGNERTAYSFYRGPTTTHASPRFLRSTHFKDSIGVWSTCGARSPHVCPRASASPISRRSRSLSPTFHSDLHATTLNTQQMATSRCVATSSSSLLQRHPLPHRSHRPRSATPPTPADARRKFFLVKIIFI